MIEDLDFRAPQLGRLRMGDKETYTDKRDGKQKERPVKLATWRATSHDEVAVKEIAALYGGETRRWDDAPEGEQYEVVTTASAVDVLVPPDALGADYERWTRGGCTRRCTGVTCMAVEGQGEDAQLVEGPCWCKAHGLTPGDGDDVKKGACDLVVRLNVVLPNVSGLGVWRLDTGSVFAYRELRGQVEMLRRLAGSMLDIPAQLCIEQRSLKKPGQPTKEFVVPVLRVRRTLNELLASAHPALPPGVDPTTGERALESSRSSTIGHLPPHVQQVVYACGEHGVSQAESEALCAHFTGGHTRSRKDLNLGQAGAFIAVLEDGTWRSIVDQDSPPEPSPKKNDEKARTARIRDLQTRAQKLLPAHQDAMKVWLDQTYAVAKGKKALRDMTPGDLNAIDVKLTGYEAQAAETPADDDEAVEGEVVA